MKESSKSLPNTYNKADNLFNEVKDLLDDVAQLQKSPDELIPLSSEQLSDVMSKRRKALKLTYEDLELQTGLSESTLRRVIQSPMNTSLGNFLKVAKELGVKTWFEE